MEWNTFLDHFRVNHCDTAEEEFQDTLSAKEKKQLRHEIYISELSKNGSRDVLLKCWRSGNFQHLRYVFDHNRDVEGFMKQAIRTNNYKMIAYICWIIGQNNNMGWFQFVRAALLSVNIPLLEWIRMHNGFSSMNIEVCYEMILILYDRNEHISDTKDHLASKLFQYLFTTLFPLYFSIWNKWHIVGVFDEILQHIAKTCDSMFIQFIFQCAKTDPAFDVMRCLNVLTPPVSWTCSHLQFSFFVDTIKYARTIWPQCHDLDYIMEQCLLIYNIDNHQTSIQFLTTMAHAGLALDYFKSRHDPPISSTTALQTVHGIAHNFSQTLASQSNILLPELLTLVNSYTPF